MKREKAMSNILTGRHVIASLVCAGFLALAPALAGAADALGPDVVSQGENQQVQIRSSTQKVRTELGALIDELDANGIGGEDVKTLRAIQNILGILSDKDMDTVIQLLQQARAANDPSSVRRDVTQAVVTQKTVVVKMRELLLTYQRQQELYDLSLRLEQLAGRQNTNLKNLVGLVRTVGRKSAAQYDDVEKSSLSLQDSEQGSIRDEVGLLLSKLADLAKESDPDTADRLTKSIEQARLGKLEESLRSAANDLQNALPFQAGSAEKNARDRLYDLARLVVPQQDALARLRKAIDDVDKMIAQEQRIADQTAALDAKHPDAQKAADIEQQQGDLVDQSDRTRKDIEHLAPDANDAIKDAQSHMQDTRSALNNTVPARDKAKDQEKQSLSKLTEARKALDSQLAKEMDKKPEGDAAAQAKALKDKVEQLKQAQTKLNDQTAAATPAAAPERGKDQDALAQQERNLEPEAAAQSLDKVAEELANARTDMNQASQSLNSRNTADAQPPQKSAVDHLAKAEDLLDQRLAQLDQEKKDLKNLEDARDKVAKLIQDEHQVAHATDKAAANEPPKPEAPQAADQQPPTAQPAEDAKLAQDQSQVAQKTDQTKNELPDAGKEAAAPLNDAKNAMNDAKAKLDQQKPKNAQPPQQQAMNDLNKAKDALDKKIEDMQKDLGQPPDQNTDLADLNQKLQDAQQELAQAQQEMGDAEKQEQQPDGGKKGAEEMAKAGQEMGKIANDLNKAEAKSAGVPESAKQAMQEATQDLDKGSADAGANQVPDAQGQAQQAQEALSQAQAAVTMAQQGMKAGKMGKGKGNKPGPPEMAQNGPPENGPPDNSPSQDKTGKSNGDRKNASGGGQDSVSGPARNGSSVILALPKRDRDAYLQTQKEKYPAEYDRIMEQYLKNVSDQESKQP